MQGRPTLLAVFVCQILASILIVKLISLYHTITIVRHPFVTILPFPFGLTTLFILLSLIVLDLLILVPYLSLSSMSK
jgi:hypothetical protein